MGEKDQLSPFLCGGASLVHAKPIFSIDSKYVLCCSANTVKVLSILSGECVRELVGHQALVTSIQINPANQFQIFSCSLDKCVIKWDYADGVLVKSYKGDHPLVGIYTLEDPQAPIYMLRCPIDNDGAATLVQMKLPASSEIKFGKSKDVLSKLSRCPEHTAVDLKGRYAASIEGSCLHIRILKTKTYLSYNLQKYARMSKTFSSLACHPTDFCLATGTNDGKIIYWWKFDQAPVTTIQHWHSLEVTALNFTPQGSYLLSGGHECVLVKWQNNTEYKDVLPRLGSPLVSISTASDSTLYAVGHTDNGIHVISSDRKVLQHYQGLTRSFLYRGKHHTPLTGLLIDPRTKCIVTSGRPGHLQFYDIHADKQLYNLDIIGHNYISPDNLHRPAIITAIEQAAFSEDKLWLATYERRDDHETTPETRLKLWLFQDKTQEYVLNTYVETPHSEQMTDLTFRPTSSDSIPMLASSGRDGKFKLWTLQDDTDIYKQNQCWGCESVGFYHGLPASKVAFSDDGSLLIVAFGTKLTLWDPDTNALQKVLGHNDGKEIRNMCFSCGMYGHLLMCASEGRLSVWNLLSCTVEWIISVNITVMTCDPLSGHIAAFRDGKYLQVFLPTSSTPVYTYAGASTTPVSSALFVPHPASHKPSTNSSDWQEHSRLYFINQHQEMLSFKSESEMKEMTSSQSAALVQKLPETPFSSLLTMEKRSLRVDTSKQSTESSKWTGGAFLKEMLRTPAHVLPPISSLCMPFLDSLASSPKSRIASKEEESSDSESDMDTDSENSDSENGEDVENKDDKNAENTMEKTDIPKKDVKMLDEVALFDNCLKNNFSWLNQL